MEERSRTRCPTRPEHDGQHVVALLLDPLVGGLRAPLLAAKASTGGALPPRRSWHRGLLLARLARADPVDDDAAGAVDEARFGVEVRQEQDLGAELEVQLWLAGDVLQLCEARGQQLGERQGMGSCSRARAWRSLREAPASRPPPQS